MSTLLSLPQNRVPGTLPLFFTSLVQAPRRIFWQDKPESVACCLVFGIPQNDGTLCPISISPPQKSNAWHLNPMPLEDKTLYGWQIVAAESVAGYAAGTVLCEGRLFLLNEAERDQLPHLLALADQAESNPVVLMGMTALLCRFGLYQDALQIIGRSLMAQAVSVREMMRDTARVLVYNEMSKRIATMNESVMPTKFGMWAEQMKALYAKQTEQRKSALANVGKGRSAATAVYAAQ
jgi:hypothetical protein